MYINKILSLQAILFSTIVAFSFSQSIAAGEIRLPRIGDRTVWECEGPWSQRYDIKVVDIKDGLVAYKGVVDDKDYYVEKHFDYLGTTLWTRLDADKQQWIDPYYFSSFSKLTPGTLIKGPVAIVSGKDYWTWGYEIGVGHPKKIKHPVLKNIRIVPVTEKRFVFHGKYWTKMQSEIVPSLGITVRWKFSDSTGEETCELTKFSRTK